MFNKRLFMGAIVFCISSLNVIKSEIATSGGRICLGMINNHLGKVEDRSKYRLGIIGDVLFGRGWAYTNAEEFSGNTLLMLDDVLKILTKIHEESESSNSLQASEKEKAESKLLLEIKEGFIKQQIKFLNFLNGRRLYVQPLVEWILKDFRSSEININTSIFVKFLEISFYKKESEQDAYFFKELDTLKKAKDFCLELQDFLIPFWYMLNTEIRSKSLDWFRSQHLKTEVEIEALKKGPYFVGCFEEPTPTTQADANKSDAPKVETVNSNSVS